MVNDYRPRWSFKVMPLIKQIKNLSNEQQLNVLTMAIECAKSSTDIKFTENNNKAELESVKSYRIKKNLKIKILIL